MSTLEATISMLEQLPDSDIQAIHDITYSIYKKTMSPLKPLTKEQVLQELSVSRRQIENGEYQEFETAIDEIEAKYGI